MIGGKIIEEDRHSLGMCGPGPEPATNLLPKVELRVLFWRIVWVEQRREKMVNDGEQ